MLIYYDFVQLQVFANSKSKNINFYQEMLYPAFRRHRARIRPFAHLKGSPIIHIRGTRDTNNNRRNYLLKLINFFNFFSSTELKSRRIYFHSQ